MDRLPCYSRVGWGWWVVVGDGCCGGIALIKWISEVKIKIQMPELPKFVIAKFDPKAWLSMIIGNIRSASHTPRWPPDRTMLGNSYLGVVFISNGSSSLSLKEHASDKQEHLNKLIIFLIIGDGYYWYYYYYYYCTTTATAIWPFILSFCDLRSNKKG